MPYTRLLTTALILWLMYSSYMLLRLLGQYEMRQAKMAAILKSARDYLEKFQNYVI